MTDDGMLRATTRTGLSVTQIGDAPVPTKKSAASKVAMAAAAVVLLGGGAVAALTMGKTEEPAPAIEPPPPVIVTQIVSADRPAPEIKTFKLKVVNGDEAEITLDGKKVSLSDGAIEVSGTSGSMKKVTVKVGDKLDEHLVAITEGGLVPGSVEVAEEKAKPAAPVRVVRGARPAPALKPAKNDKPAPPPPKPRTNVETGMDEFK
jgi:hypothetical protein